MNTDEHGFPDPLTGRVLLELRLRAIGAVAQASFPVIYKGRCVGEYFADLLVENAAVIELRCVERLGDEHMAQCLNYLSRIHPTVALRYE